MRLFTILLAPRGHEMDRVNPEWPFIFHNDIPRPSSASLIEPGLLGFTRTGESILLCQKKKGPGTNFEN